MQHMANGIIAIFFDAEFHLFGIRYRIAQFYAEVAGVQVRLAVTIWPPQLRAIDN
jgi:hypothetical protein